MSVFGGQKSPGAPSSPTNPPPQPQEVQSSSSPSHWADPSRDSPTPLRSRAHTTSSSRPMSMVQTYQPPLMEIGQDVIPELAPIFTFLNSHSNKLYQEGYFLKLNDLDSHGRPNADRTWTECFAQLVGTVLSLWDAAELDAAGQEGEVPPRFINLADASIKMIETLPTRSQGVQPLQNVLSISTAGKNRYLFHFNSLHSLTQWTAGIRLAMFENASLQESYTGSLIAGKGKTLNNIKNIMERIRFKHEDWARVRFGAGTPWRRCWCVISPPDEKEVNKAQKSLKKKSAYDRQIPVLKGDIKFYDTKKTKKATPIATINDAYSAYAIYPQSKPLIDQSTLVKVEGIITIHSTPETTTEGFVFVMPESHAAVTGFEMLLRWLFPLYDIFGLYGRPSRLIADTLDPRSLMFALPQERRYGYLETLDVAQLIHEPGSDSWSDREWRRRLKELTSSRISMWKSNGSRPRSRASSYRGHRNSLPSRAGTLRYDDGASMKSMTSLHGEAPPPMPPPHKTGSAPPGEGPFQPPHMNGHQRSVSETTGFATSPRHQRFQRSHENQHTYMPSRLSYEKTRPNEFGELIPPAPPTHGVPVTAQGAATYMQKYANELDGNDRSSSESERRSRAQMPVNPQNIKEDIRPSSPPKPVAAPPAFAHEPGAKPQKRPALSPELRRATSRMSITTLAQLAEAGQLSPASSAAAAGAAAAWKSNGQQRNGTVIEDQASRGVIDDASRIGTKADRYANIEGTVVAGAGRIDSPSNYPRPSDPSTYGTTAGVLPSSSHQGHSSSLSGLTIPLNSAPQGSFPLSQSSNLSPFVSQAPTNKSQNAFSPDRDDTQYSTSRTETTAPDLAVFSNAESTENRRPDMSRINTSRSITRKPVPSKSTNPVPVPARDLSTSPARSSLESLRQRVVDEDALAQVIAYQGDRSYTMNSVQSRQDSVDGSVYDDDSTASPDYASTRKSTETRRSKPSMDRPRAGVLKTVGTVEPVQQEVVVGDTHYQPGLSKPEISPAIPSVDFGPTHVYTPGTRSRPSTSGTMTPQVFDNPKASDRLTPSPQPSPQNGSPGRKSAGANAAKSTYANGPYEQSLIRDLVTPEGRRESPLGNLDNESPRTVAWQPAPVGANSPTSRQSISPEQFVQQRATASRATPVYAHGRKQSPKHSPSPSASRNPSGEVPTLQHSRQASLTKDLPPRPHSRNASMLMKTPADYTAHLSAREQEHVARVTGSPLINMAGRPTRQDQGPPGGGLVGAIEAREREKKDIKDGLSSHMVQHAIAQRQQHGQGLQQRQPSFPNPSPQMQMPGAFPQTPQFQMPGQFAPTPNQYTPVGVLGQQQHGWPSQHQQQQQLAMPPQQQPQQWVSHAQRMYWGAPHYSTAPQQQPQQYQQGIYQQQQQPQPGQYNGGQQQFYGPYFGNGQGNRR
ncbi:MAG: hypothetical protein Q9190_002739 [Brigantiaea leucoxantha]